MTADEWAQKSLGEHAAALVGDFDLAMAAALFRASYVDGYVDSLAGVNEPDDAEAFTRLLALKLPVT